MATKSLKEEAGTAVQKVNPNTAMAFDDVPDFLKDVTTMRGTEDIDFSKMVIPRLAIAQKGSDQRKKQNEKYIEGLDEGMVFNSLTGQIYDRPVKFIPLFFYTSRIHFKPLAEGGGIICQAPDGVHCQLNNGGPCLHQAWGKQGEKPACTEFYNFGVMLPDFNMESLVLSLKSTGLDAAKQLNSFIRMRKKDAFAGVYEMDTLYKVEGQMDWYIPLISNAGWATKDQYKVAEEAYDGLFKGLKSGKVTFDAEVTPSDAAFASRDAEM